MSASKISAQQQVAIEAILKSWAGKLTWELLISAIKLEVGMKVTRQTLCTYKGINSEYKIRKGQLRVSKLSADMKIGAGDVKDSERISYLKAKISVLEKNNAEQLRMIERILSNAILIPNLDLNFLVRGRPEEL